MDDVRKLCLSCRRNAKGERVLVHFNGARCRPSCLTLPVPLTSAPARPHRSRSPALSFAFVPPGSVSTEQSRSDHPQATASRARPPMARSGSSTRATRSTSPSVSSTCRRGPARLQSTSSTARLLARSSTPTISTRRREGRTPTGRSQTGAEGRTHPVVFSVRTLALLLLQVSEPCSVLLCNATQLTPEPLCSSRVETAAPTRAERATRPPRQS